LVWNRLLLLFPIGLCVGRARPGAALLTWPCLVLQVVDVYDADRPPRRQASDPSACAPHSWSLLLCSLQTGPRASSIDALHELHLAVLAAS
jgi:hypothetical protein